jgi:pimeloyl-ACP methyl ester carboxylesterase
MVKLSYSFRITGALVAAAVALSGCSSSKDKASKKDGATNAAATQGSVKWAPCTDSEELKELQCAEVQLPLDHAKPDGEKITLALSRRPHRGDDYRGVFLTNPGGPGLPGRSLPAAAESLANGIGDKFDWIGMDARGMGASKPAVSCDPKYLASPKTPYKPVDDQATQRWVERVKGYAEACKKSEQFALLSHMTTLDIVKDYEAVRVALGVEKVNYFGGSYGALVGQILATTYPDHVERVVLDSVPAPDDSWYASNVRQNTAMTAAFQVFAEWLANDDATYHLGTDPAAIASKAFAKVDELATTTPAPGSPGSAELTDMLVKAGYGKPNWPMVGGALSAAVNRGDLTTVAPGSESDNALAAYLAVECSETTWPDLNTMIRDARAIASANPLMTWSNTWMNAPCASWPVPSQPRAAVDGSRFTKPILMLAETLDAATPIAGTYAARDRFPSARLVVGKGGTSHAVGFNAKPCVADALAAYIDTGALPDRATGSGVADKECEPVDPPPAAPAAPAAPAPGG